MRFCVFLIAAFGIGCASKGFHRGEIRNMLAQGTPTYDDKAIQEAFKKKPNLPKPFKIGVYFRAPHTTPGVPSAWRWSEKDKAQLATLGEELKAQGVVSEVFPILDSVVEGEDLQSLRLTAAKHQADALLIVSGAGEIDRFINGWGWSYALLLPTLFVKGSEAKTLFVSNATLWDVRNEFLYLAVETEAELRETYAAAFGQSDKELLNSAKTQSLERLRTELANRMKSTKM